MNGNDASRVIAVVDKRIERHVRSEARVETTWATVCGISDDGLYASAYLYGETEYPSHGFRIPGSLMVSVGDSVKVAWDPRGYRWIEDVATATPYKKIEIDPNTGTIKTGDGTARPSLLIANSSGVVVGTHNHDADYADIAHDHDADYSGVAHTHPDPTTLRVTGTSDASLSSTDHPVQIGPTNSNNLIIDTNEIMARFNGAASDLYLNADGGRVRVGGLQLRGAGTAFPASPTTNDIFFREDRGVLYYYDGTRWLSTTRHTMHFDTAQPTASSTVFAISPFSGDYDIYVEAWWSSIFPSSVSDGSNYYNMFLQTSVGAASTTQIGSTNTSLTAGQWAQRGVWVGAIVSGKPVIQVSMVKVGASAGSPIIASYIQYRLVG